MERVMGRGQKIGIFVACGTGLRCTMAGRFGTVMGTGQTIDAHTGTDGQCTDIVETGVGADGSARILHADMGSGGLGWAKSRTRLHI